MSKVICDVCGTTYPDTAAQCPICNSANHAQNQTAAGEDGGDAVATGYERTKGGRFSKKNVRKRSTRSTAEPRRKSAGSPEHEEEPSSTGLVIVVVLLLVAIVAVLIYIGVHFFQSSDSGDGEDTKGNSVLQTEQTGPEETDVVTGTPCEGLVLSNDIVELTAAGNSLTLVVQLTPMDTTDTLIFTSSDPTVAEISADGTITAIGGGQTIITAQCGEFSATCTVVCSFGGDTTEPTEPKVELVFEWNTRWVDDNGYGDTTMSKPGETWRCYKNSLNVNPAEITWTSDNPEICTIVNGIVTAVSPGTTKVHAEYNGQKFTAYVRCKWTVEEPTEPTQPAESTEPVNPTDPTEETQTTEPTQGTTVTYSISHGDVTLHVSGTGMDKAFNLTLKDQDGNVIEVVWTASGDSVSIEGNKITAVSVGTVTVSTTYEGVTYSCTVRVVE